MTTVDDLVTLKVLESSAYKPLYALQKTLDELPALGDMPPPEALASSFEMLENALRIFRYSSGGSQHLTC